MTYGEVNASTKSPGYIRSPDKLKMEYFFLQKIYDHKTFQGADIWQGEAHNEVARIWSRDHNRPRFKLKT